MSEGWEGGKGMNGSCTRCGMPVHFPERTDEPQDITCERCGTKHTLAARKGKTDE